MRHLILNLEASLLSFGGPAVDSNGPTDRHPGQAMITGLLGNALGIHRPDRDRLQRLQERIIMGSRLDRPGSEILDYQTAQISQEEIGWTTRGEVEGRAIQRGRTGAHQRYMRYLADAFVVVALRLDPADEEPTLDDVAHALQYPAHPLHIGRKSCLPTRRIFGGFVDAETIPEVLAKAPRLTATPDRVQARWPKSEGVAGETEADITDERNWTTRLHGGLRHIVEGRITLETAQ